MSKLSDAYDTLITRIEAVLPQHLRLANPYELGENADSYLKKGYGLAVRPADNTHRSLSCKISIKRLYDVVVTRRFVAREIDAVSKASTEKQILEDLYLLIRDLEKNTSLNGIAVTKYEADSGITFIRTEMDQYMAIRATISAETIDDL